MTVNFNVITVKLPDSCAKKKSHQPARFLRAKPNGTHAPVTRQPHFFFLIYSHRTSPPSNCRPPLPTHSMPLLRPLSRSSACNAPLKHTTRRLGPIYLQPRRSLTSTHPPDISEHPSPDTAGHDSHYDPPTGWLFGVPPGEKYKEEGWEKTWVWGFWGSLAFGVFAYAYKPDTS